MKKSRDSQKAFDDHFASVYGERWPRLRAALLTAPEREVLRNPFGASLADYTLDKASLASVEQLALAPGLRIADFCASPGGKTLASIFKLRGEGEWFCNDLSPARLTRLKSVLHDSLPEEILSRVRFSRADASRFGMRYPETFDRVLVDAPCSGERHLLASIAELARWSLKGSKRLSVRQHALACAGIDSAREGGRMVYSTCSISPLENDEVIRKLQKSRAGRFRVLSNKYEIGEPTEFGWILLPDQCGCGPIYFAALERL